MEAEKTPARSESPIDRGEISEVDFNIALAQKVQRRAREEAQREEAKRVRKLQQRAQDEFHKRLILADGYNLVSNRMKADFDGSFEADPEAAEEVIKSKNYGQKVKVRFVQKKLRPREIIAASKKASRTKKRELEKHIRTVTELS